MRSLDELSFFNRIPIAVKVFIAPSLVILLLFGTIVVAQLALQRQQAAFLQVIGGPFRTSISTTDLIVAIAQAHGDVLRYAQLQQRVAPGDRVLRELARSIDDQYSRIDELFSAIKRSTGPGEADAVSNISDFLIIHRAVARRIVSGESTGTTTISTLLAHYQQLQSYVVELATRSLESAQATEASVSQYLNRFARYLAIGAVATILVSVLVTFYIGRLIARPITEMILALNQIVAGKLSVSVAGLGRRDEIGDMARAVDRFAAVSRELKEARQQAEAANAHKSAFLASMSHELRTPLNAILGFNEMLLGGVYGPVPGSMQEPLTDIQASGQHLLRLINNVLDLAKIEAGRMDLMVSECSVHDVLDKVRSALRSLAASKGLELHVEVPADFPVMRCDVSRVTQCLMNLAGNALKFTHQGRVEISVALRGEQALFKIADTGIGIAPEKIGKLFSEFQQADATIANEYGGSGLGLSITRKFVEMHGGRLWVESTLGKGSNFFMELPITATPRAAA